MKRLAGNLILGLFFQFIFLGCSHLSQNNNDPSSFIKNNEARENFLLIQQKAHMMSFSDLYLAMTLLHQAFPDENIITITRAGLLGDYAQTMSFDKELKMKSEALKILKPYNEKKYLNSMSQERILANNQYYYHSGQYKKLYDFGKKVIKEGGHGGEVLVAVGGSMNAIALDKENKINEARILALEARQMWERIYDLSDASYREAAHKNSYYVSSLALTGECYQAEEIYNTVVKKSLRFKEMPRWYHQFNPELLNNCKTKIQLSKNRASLTNLRSASY